MLLNWSTAEEENAGLYLIERSFDAINWRVIGEVEASKGTAILNNYHYTDKQTPALSSLVYYRIRQVDNDGHFAYSAIKTIHIKPSNTGISISPLANNILVKFSQPLKGNVLVRLVTFSGQVVKQQTYSQPMGQILFSKGVIKGAYLLCVISEPQIRMTKQVILH